MMRIRDWSLVMLAGILLAAGSIGLTADDTKNANKDDKQSQAKSENSKNSGNSQGDKKSRPRIVHEETIALVHGTGVRSSTLVGLDVVNEKGESLGSVSDMVVNLENGQIEYVATSFGCFLGIGDKMFAIPWKSLRFTHAKDNPDHKLLVLDMPAETLKNAPGFDQNHWPGTQDNAYWVRIDKFYQADSKTGRTNSAKKNSDAGVDNNKNKSSGKSTEKGKDSTKS